MFVIILIIMWVLHCSVMDLTNINQLVDVNCWWKNMAVVWRRLTFQTIHQWMVYSQWLVKDYNGETFIWGWVGPWQDSDGSYSSTIAWTRTVKEDKQERRRDHDSHLKIKERRCQESKVRWWAIRQVFFHQRIELIMRGEFSMHILY